ncbi:PREDICTED: probable G-protein coupled receptor Mth-like 5 [Polistes canadensis]|uniref:probable G-protein coupled receptor Mth-like 5 n=1 Tax=Polistes canadensis TaxID=91411 RepID=UPI000718E8C7|nr:PREDICTED: probable G-protein coupled receptor Mth-like 5 [Polistes canadensis]
MHLVTALLLVSFLASHSRFAGGNTNTNEKPNTIKIAKCCELSELLLDDTCTPLSITNETKPWQPEYTQDKDSNIFLRTPPTPDYRIGLPRCRSNEHQWHVYYYPSGPDRLAIVLPLGKLRHYVDDLNKEISRSNGGGAFESFRYDDEEDETKYIHYDYSFGQYCVDKAVLSRDHFVATYAMICVPEVPFQWSDPNYLMKHAIDPIFHAISIAAYLVVAVVYFVLPQLRDLVGNMITSMTLCLITNQCATTVKIFTEFGNHVNFMIADIIAYTSSLAAFFWLNTLGYYVWKTFRSRNVFLRTTDGKKYCYYSAYVWGATISISTTAIFAHFALETDKPFIGGTAYPAQETVGWLALSVLYMSIALTIIIDFSFILTTANRIKRMSTYGRIHHKMKYSFRMFVLLFAIMSISWITLLLAGLKYDAFAYCHVVVNLLQALFILHICVFGQRRVTFLLGKTCNCSRNGDNIEGFDWGEEMTAINAGY